MQPNNFVRLFCFIFCFILQKIMKKYLVTFSLILLTTLCSFIVTPNKKIITSVDAKIGRLLFFDTRLSINKTKSCASCHNPALAYTDGLITPNGALGDTVKRNSPTLINLFENETFNWADDNIRTLQQQSNIPLFGIHPVEMGCDSTKNLSLDFTYSDLLYKPLFAEKSITKINWLQVKDFIAAYVKTFNFSKSKYDKYLTSNTNLNNEEYAGKRLFFSDKLNCKKCHSGNDFDEPEFTRMNHYQNIGLYNIGKDSLYANDDNGLQNVSKDKDDIGKFKIPSLRNIAVTAPYFHDGSAASLEVVIENYARGGRLTTKGKNTGDGKLHPNKNQFVEGFKITNKEKQQLISFLKTLTDTTYLLNPFYQNPFLTIN